VRQCWRIRLLVLVSSHSLAKLGHEDKEKDKGKDKGNDPVVTLLAEISNSLKDLNDNFR
jgi:hypothetical protein